MASESADGINLFELEENERLKWAVKRHAVIATWREEMDDSEHTLWHLGSRTPHNQEESPLHIWIGEDVGNGQLLVVLDIRIRLRSSSKTAPRQMFLVVPSESLHIKTTAPTFEQLSRHDVPHMLVEQPSDKRSADSARILHIAFSLARDASSKVVMPKAGSQRPTIGQPLHLLQSLRSLSKARTLNVYLNFNTYAQQHLHALATRLDTGTLLTPSVNLASMYAGRGGSVNNWCAQGLFDNDQDVSSAYKRRKLSTDVDAQIVAPDQPPPPYSTRGGQTRVPRSCTPASPVPGSESGSFVPETPLVRQGQSAGRDCTNLRSPVNAPLLADDSLPINQPQPVNTSHLSKPLPANAALSANVHLSANVPPPSHVLLPVDAPLPPRILLPIDSPLLAANVTNPATNVPMSTSGPRSSSASQSANVLPRNVLPTSVIPANAPLLATASRESDALSRRIYPEMCLWLTKAWVTCPNAHFIHIAHLLTIGAAAYEEDRTRYAQRRADSTTDLLYYNAQNKSGSHHDTTMHFLCTRGRRASVAVREKALKQETARMILWMNIVKPNADLLLLRECLAGWAEKGVRLIEFDQDGLGHLDQYTALLKDFNQSKALCVTETCLLFGRQALPSVDEIVEMMRKEIA